MIKWLLNKLPHTTITIEGKPYLTRYYLFFKDRKWGNVYIHHFHSSDQGTELHSHPWAWGLSLILWGGYDEERSRDPNTWVGNELDDLSQAQKDWIELPTPARIEKRSVRPGTLNFIRSTHFHRVDLKDEVNGAWSIFFAGPRTQDWGFLDRNTSEFKNWRNNPEAIE